MTEAEWLACDDYPYHMLKHLRGKAGERKLRLLACACCRLNRSLTGVEGLEGVLSLAERYADGSATRDALRHATIPQQSYDMDLGIDPLREVRRALCSRDALNGAIHALPPSEYWDECCDLIRCVFGTPSFPPTDGRRWLTARKLIGLFSGRPTLSTEPPPDPPKSAIVAQAWLTDTVLVLARQMYESREFGAMPILADALQDAGCDNEDILAHCRDANATHVRGCWVVDLVLGKE